MILAFVIMVGMAAFMWSVWEEFTGLIQDQLAAAEAQQQARLYDQEAA